jgi:hypothetical protein
VDSSLGVSTRQSARVDSELAYECIECPHVRGSPKVLDPTKRLPRDANPRGQLANGQACRLPMHAEPMQDVNASAGNRNPGVSSYPRLASQSQESICGWIWCVLKMFG